MLKTLVQYVVTHIAFYARLHGAFILVCMAGWLAAYGGVYEIIGVCLITMAILLAPTPEEKQDG